MTCKDAGRWLSPYLDSELGRTETFEVSEHLRNCPACAARFRQEGRVDEMICAWLSAETMPDMLREKIHRQVLAPRKLRISGINGALALAACIALLAVGIRFLVDPPHAAALPAVVAQFADLTPGDAVFARSLPAPRTMPDVMEQMLDRPFVMPPNSGRRHTIEVVGMTERIDASGRGYLEIRANCCDKPMMLYVARAESGVLPDPFHEVPLVDGETLRTYGDINVAAQTFDNGFAVLVASRHQVKHVIRSVAETMG